MSALATPSVSFLTRDAVAARFAGKRVAVVGSGPSCLRNKAEFIDGHDLVVRVNNYKVRRFEKYVGTRTDVHYSFYGHSIKKTAAELLADGVTLCMCKCPDGKPIDSPWHIGPREVGVDFRWIYERRRLWWFCDTYIPSAETFLAPFRALGSRVPTTGFACLYELLQFDCEVYVTGFDFFASRIHNVNERWRARGNDDPIRHAPERERAWLATYARKHSAQVRLDTVLRRLIG